MNRQRRRAHVIALASALALPTLMTSSFCSATTPTFSSGLTTGTLQNASITEASGIVAFLPKPVEDMALFAAIEAARSGVAPPTS